MDDFIRQLRHQEKLHRRSGANGLADLFMNAAKELEQQQIYEGTLEQELKVANCNLHLADRKIEQLNSVATQFIGNLDEVVELLEASGDAANIVALVNDLNSIGAEFEKITDSPQTSLAEIQEQAINQFANWMKENTKHDPTGYAHGYNMANRIIGDE